MTITDKDVLKLIASAKSNDLAFVVRTYPQDEVGERTDLDILKNELYWLIDTFEDDGTFTHSMLASAKRIVAETKNGKVMPLYTSTLEPKYSKQELIEAQELVAEYKRLKRLQRKLGAF